MENNTKVFKVARRWPTILSRPGRFYMLAVQSTRMIKEIDFDLCNERFGQIYEIKNSMYHRSISQEKACHLYGNIIQLNTNLVVSNLEDKPLGEDLEQLICDFDFLQNSDA